MVAPFVAPLIAGVGTAGFQHLLGQMNKDKPVNPNVSGAGMQYLNQIGDVGKRSYEPYVAEGEEARQSVNPVYRQMARSPVSFLQRIQQQYSPTEGYKLRERKGLEAAQNAAAAGGYVGTPYDQEQQAGIVQGLLGEDMQQFLQNVLGIQGAGLQGSENVIGRGFQSSSNLADYLGSNLGQMAQMAYGGAGSEAIFQNQRARQKEAERMERNRALMNFGSDLLGSYFAGDKSKAPMTPPATGG